MHGGVAWRARIRFGASSLTVLFCSSSGAHFLAGEADHRIFPVTPMQQSLNLSRSIVLFRSHAKDSARNSQNGGPEQRLAWKSDHHWERQSIDYC